MRERIGILNEWDIRKNKGDVLAIDDSTNLSFNNKHIDNMELFPYYIGGWIYKWKVLK